MQEQSQFLLVIDVLAIYIPTVQKLTLVDGRVLTTGLFFSPPVS